MNGTTKPPLFLVFSFPKCATTSLDVSLRAHPELCLPQNCKEIYFPSPPSPWDQDWFEGHFSPTESHSLFGEVTTETFFHDRARTWLLETYPDAKIIVLLRDPIERMTSHYFHALRRGYIKGSIAEALEMDDSLEIGNDPTLSFRGIGDLYKPSIEWLQANISSAQIHFALFEELMGDPNTVRRIECFLGVSPSGGALASENRRRLPRSQLVSSATTAFYQITQRLTTLTRPIFPRALRDILGRQRFRMTKAVRSLEEANMSPVDQKTLVDVDSETYNRMANHYNKTLSGLDQLMGKDLNAYWPWFQPRS
jgi:hypothetical protein